MRGIKTCIYIVIAFTLGRHCACTTSWRDARKVLLNRVADGVSRPYHPDAWRSFSRWTRLLGYATACCVLLRESRHRSFLLRVSTPSHPREVMRSRALLIGRINFVIKSSRIITEHDRGRLDRPAVSRHDEIIKDQLQRALSADRPHRGFTRAPTTALYLR